MHRFFQQGVLSFAMALLWSAAGAAPAVSELILLHHARPPYMSTNEAHQVVGLVASRVESALNRAQLPHRWVEVPAMRQLTLVQGGDRAYCALGWFRNAEREALGRYTQPVYRDRPIGALVHAQFAASMPSTAKEAIARHAGDLLLKMGYSYGVYFDDLLAHAPTPVARAGIDEAGLVRMVAFGRARWMLAAPEEAQVLLAGAGAPGQVRWHAFTDVPPGETRHLYCSKLVPVDWIQRIDAALAELPP